MQPGELLNISKHGTVPETMMRTRTIELWMVIFKVGVTRETNLLVSALDLLLSIFISPRGVLLARWTTLLRAIFLTCRELQHVLDAIKKVNFYTYKLCYA